MFQSTFCRVSWPANDVLRVPIRFPRLPLRSPRVPIQSFGVFMKSHRVPWTFLKQLFGQDVPLKNQLVHLGGHFGCQKVTLATAKITLSTWYIAWAPFEVARGLSEIPQGGWGFFLTLACSENKVMKNRHARIFLLFRFYAISQLCTGRFCSNFDGMITTSNLQNSGENRIFLSRIV